MKDYGPEAHAILEAARHADDPSDLELRRAGRAVALRLGVGTAVLLTSATAWGGIWSKITIALLLVGATGGGSSLWWRSTHLPKVPATVITPTVVTTRTLELAPVSLVIAPLASTRVNHTTSRRLTSPSPAATPSRLEEETDFIASANRKLDAGQKIAALVLLDEYDRLFPKGLLREESAATRTIVQCQISGSREATARARLFIDQHPRSPLRPRVEHACLSDKR